MPEKYDTRITCTHIEERYRTLFLLPLDIHTSGIATESEISEIITHEETHARQYHSADVLVSEIMCTFCWFNPFVWLMKREVRGNLEYMADHRVLETDMIVNHTSTTCWDWHITRLQQIYQIVSMFYHLKIVSK